MAFDVQRCYARSVWCGNGAVPNQPKDETIYIRAGTRHECLKKGVGVGLAQERKKNLPAGSLQHIKYVGPQYEANFQNSGIRTQQDLLGFARRKPTRKVKNLLVNCLTNKNGTVDTRAFNSVVLFLIKNKIDSLPNCY